MDNGCSSHMTGVKDLFKTTDDTQKMIVRLGDNKAMQVEAKDSSQDNRRLSC